MTRHPTRIFGLDMDRARLYERIDARVDAIVAGGGEEEARRADALGAGRTARKALGLNELLAGDLETMKRRSPQLRPPPAHLDAQNPRPDDDRPHRPRPTPRPLLMGRKRI